MSKQRSRNEGEAEEELTQPDGQSEGRQWSLVVPRPAVWGGVERLRHRRAEERKRCSSDGPVKRPKPKG